jgi:hypothetical protein
MGKNKTSSGRIASRACRACGHHEVGFIDEEGVFRPLEPGTRIQILENAPPLTPESVQQPEAVRTGAEMQPEQAEEVVWLPAPLKGDRSLRLKYGVLKKGTSQTNRMDIGNYRMAYLEKLRRLIEKEVYTPVAVILDRFFTAPHLASGSPEEIALRMWEELEEVRTPVTLVEEWLKSPTEANLARLIRPKSKEDLTEPSVAEPQLKKELQELTLEEFLGLL